MAFGNSFSNSCLCVRVCCYFRVCVVAAIAAEGDGRASNFDCIDCLLCQCGAAQHLSDSHPLLKRCMSRLLASKSTIIQLCIVPLAPTTQHGV